jgi:hypothetical protein
VALKPRVLILTNKLDVSADLVVLCLQRRGVEYLRINVEDCPESLTSFSFPECSWSWEDPFHGTVDTSQLSAVWFRRPGVPLEDHQDMSSATKSFVAEQWKAFFLGLRALPGVRWINDPVANFAAEAKTLQLATAVRVGLPVPRTVITNDVRQVRLLGDPLVAKAVGSALVEEEDESFFIYTSEADPGEASDSEVRLAPVIFQRRLWPKEDYRVTLVGPRVFVAKIAEQNQQLLDWRASSVAPLFETAQIPGEIERKLLALVAQLGLTFGAADLCRVGEDWFFLEVNPNGEWGWLETSVGLPVSEAIVDELCRPC